MNTILELWLPLTGIICVTTAIAFFMRWMWNELKKIERGDYDPR